MERPQLILISLFFFSWYGDHLDIHSFLHDALPISGQSPADVRLAMIPHRDRALLPGPLLGRQRDEERIAIPSISQRSEEHTSELQSHHDLVCRLLLEKKKC